MNVTDPDDLTFALRLVLAYRTGHGKRIPMTRQADREMVPDLGWEQWIGRRAPAAPSSIEPLVLVHLWAAFEEWPAVVEVVTYFAQHDLDVDAYFVDARPAGWPDWLAIVGLA